MSPPGPPVLGINLNTKSTANVTWPSSYDNFIPESSLDLKNWSYVGLSPVVTNYFARVNDALVSVKNLLVNVPTTNPPVQFFRLAQ